MDLLKSDREAGQLSSNILKLVGCGLWRQYDIQDRSYTDGVCSFVTQLQRRNTVIPTHNS